MKTTFALITKSLTIFLLSFLIKIKFIICFLLIVTSCSRKLYDVNYGGEPNYHQFYVVDTIKINDPVRIHPRKFGGQFIVSRSQLKEYNNKRDFFDRPDVFLLGQDLYRVLPLEGFDKYSYPDNGGCQFEPSALSISGLETYELKDDSVVFLLGLINANFLYQKFNSYSSFSYKDKGSKRSFYKIVFPLCDQDDGL